MLGRCPPWGLWDTQPLLSAETPNTLPPAELQEKSYLPSSAQGCRLGLAGKEEHDIWMGVGALTELMEVQSLAAEL